LFTILINMKNPFFIAVLFTVFLTSMAYAQQKGWMSRYWDGCKPSCSWTPNAGAGNLCKECNAGNNEITPPNENSNASSCAGGNSYTCWDMIPFRDPIDENLAYGFAATPGGSGDCGKCYEITFDGGQNSEPTDPFATNKALNGKKLIVMASNIGYDVAGGQFDLLVPGGGLGAFDSFTKQLGLSDASILGKNHGGLASACQDELIQTLGWWEPGSSDGGRNVKTVVVEWQECLRNKCDAVFGKPEHALLKQGCRFYADWFMAADNPTLTYRRLDNCPNILVNRYNVGSGGSIPTPGAPVKVLASNISHAKITLMAEAKSFTAIFPANHGYTSYKLIDLNGKEMRRGFIGTNATTLKFDNVKSGVTFLSLEGKGVSTVVRAVVY